MTLNNASDGRHPKHYTTYYSISGVSLQFFCSRVRALLAQMGERAGESHSAAERRESDEARAHGIVTKEFKRLRWTVDDLARRPKGDSRKVDIAWRLRTETTMTLKWTATELQMGAWTHMSYLLSQRAGKRAGEVSK